MKVNFKTTLIPLKVRIVEATAPLLHQLGPAISRILDIREGATDGVIMQNASFMIFGDRLETATVKFGYTEPSGAAKEYAFTAEQTYFADGAINVPLQFWGSIDVDISKGATVTVTSADGSDSRTVAIRPEE